MVSWTRGAVTKSNPSELWVPIVELLATFTSPFAWLSLGTENHSSPSSSSSTASGSLRSWLSESLSSSVSESSTFPGILRSSGSTLNHSECSDPSSDPDAFDIARARATSSSSFTLLGVVGASGADSSSLSLGSYSSSSSRAGGAWKKYLFLSGTSSPCCTQSRIHCGRIMSNSVFSIILLISNAVGFRLDKCLAQRVRTYAWWCHYKPRTTTPDWSLTEPSYHSGPSRWGGCS